MLYGAYQLRQPMPYRAACEMRRPGYHVHACTRGGVELVSTGERIPVRVCSLRRPENVSDARY